MSPSQRSYGSLCGIHSYLRTALELHQNCGRINHGLKMNCRWIQQRFFIKEQISHPCPVHIESVSSSVLYRDFSSPYQELNSDLNTNYITNAYDQSLQPLD